MNTIISCLIMIVMVTVIIMIIIIIIILLWATIIQGAQTRWE